MTAPRCGSPSAPVPLACPANAGSGGASSAVATILLITTTTTTNPNSEQNASQAQYVKCCYSRVCIALPKVYRSESVVMFFWNPNHLGKAVLG